MAVCCHIGCKEEATHALKLIVPDRWEDEPAAEGLLGAELCALHAAEAEDNEFAPVQPMIAALANALRFPAAQPDFEQAYLTAIPMRGAEWRAFKALECRPN